MAIIPPRETSQAVQHSTCLAMFHLPPWIMALAKAACKRGLPVKVEIRHFQG